MARSRLLSTARISVYINNRLYGRCGGISWAASTPHKAARGVDIPYVLERMPTTFDITGTLSVYRLINDGGLEGAGLQAPQSMLSREKYFTLVLVDRDTDTTILRIEQAIVEGQSWQAIAKNFMLGSVQFSGIMFTNEVG